MILIKGASVKLHSKTKTGVDAFNNPVYSEQIITVDNVLIEPTGNEEVASEYELTGKKLFYTLHIPKGDTNNWLDSIIELPDPWNKSVKSYGDYLVYDSKLVPLAWNKKVKTELYE